MSETARALSSRPRRLLMISHAFPPVGGAGVQRSAMFAKFLPQFGWSPLVWTADYVVGWPRDESLLADLPADLDRRSLDTLKRRNRRQRRSTVPVGGALHARARGALGQMWAWRVARARWGFRQWLLPDDQVLWAFASLRCLKRIARDEGIDAIYSTYSPASSHLLAWRLKEATGKPWVADFRDLWTDNYDHTDRSKIRRGARSWFQDRFLGAADVVVGVSPDQTRILAGHLPEQASKFVTVTNGVDPADFEGLEQNDARGQLGISSDRFVVSYVGTITTDDHPGEMFQGIRKFVEYLGDQRGRFELRIVGRISGALLRVVEAAGYRAVLTGYVPHGDAIREMVAADCLLLMNPVVGTNCASVRPAKIYEYLASGRYILHLGVPGGASDEVIAACNGGETILPDPDLICRKLRELWTRWLSGRPSRGCSPERLAPFTRRELTGRLAGILDGLLIRDPQMRDSHQSCPDRVSGGIPRIAIRGL
ncbi:MAG: glycosyltransferase [Phycisphaerae bacterium]